MRTIKFLTLSAVSLFAAVAVLAGSVTISRQKSTSNLVNRDQGRWQVAQVTAVTDGSGNFTVYSATLPAISVASASVVPNGSGLTVKLTGIASNAATFNVSAATSGATTTTLSAVNYTITSKTLTNVVGSLTNIYAVVSTLAPTTNSVTVVGGASVPVTNATNTYAVILGQN